MICFWLRAWPCASAPVCQFLLLSALLGVTQGEQEAKNTVAITPQRQAPSSAESLFYRTDSLDCRATLNRLSRFTPASYAVVPTPVNMVDPVPIKSVAWVRSGPPARLIPSPGPCRRPRRALRWPLGESLPSGNIDAVMARRVSHRPVVRERGVEEGICCFWYLTTGWDRPSTPSSRWCWVQISGYRLAGRRLQGQPVITDTT